MGCERESATSIGWEVRHGDEVGSKIGSGGCSFWSSHVSLSDNFCVEDLRIRRYYPRVLLFSQCFKAAPSLTGVPRPGRRPPPARGNGHGRSFAHTTGRLALPRSVTRQQRLIERCWLDGKVRVSDVRIIRYFYVSNCT